MKLPTVLTGFVVGPVRLEACFGQEAWETSTKFTMFLLQKPFVVDHLPQPNLFAVTHLQKRSKCGLLLMRHEKWWHLCFHVWFTFKFQEQGPVGGSDQTVWIPNSEKVFYWRFGYSRWDAGDCKYMRGKFGTWYGPGLHWD